MTEIEIEEIIKQRLELCKKEVAPLIENKLEDLDGITISRKQFEDYVDALGQTFLKYAGDVKEPTLATYDHYLGRMTGIQMVCRLIDLMKAPKVPFTCDRGDTPYIAYKCGHCGTEIYEEDKFCSECGAALYLKRNNCKENKQ